MNPQMVGVYWVLANSRYVVECKKETGSRKAWLGSNMDGGDKVLVCRECRREFRFSQAERQFYEQKGFSEPTRCPDCRKARRWITEPRYCSKCRTEMASTQPAYCSQCLENARLELELKLRTLEREAAASKASDGVIKDSLGQLEQDVSQKEAQISALVEELKGVRLSNEELRAQLEEIKARDLDLTQSLRDRECRIGELTRELEGTKKELSDFKLRLELAQVSLSNAKLVAENETLRSLGETVASLESRFKEFEAQQARQNSTAYPDKVASCALQNRSLMGRLWRWLGFKSGAA